MRTRSQEKSHGKAPVSTCNKDVEGEGIHGTKKRRKSAKQQSVAPGKLNESSLNRARSQKASLQNRQEDCIHDELNMNDDVMVENSKQEEKEDFVSIDAVDEGGNLEVGRASNDGQLIGCPSSDMREDVEETYWQDGSISIKDLNEDSSAVKRSGLTVEFFDSSPSSSKKVAKRASAQEKEIAELVHKSHLLCLLARGRLVDSVCDDPLIQASLLSLLPPNLLDVTKVSKLTANVLSPIVNWFSSNFHVRGPFCLEKSFNAGLIDALESHEGTAEEVAALSVALFRALNLTTRFVSVLDVASLKPADDMIDSLKEERVKVFQRKSSNLFTNVASTSTASSRNISNESPKIHGLPVRGHDLSCKIDHPNNSSFVAHPNDGILEPSARNDCNMSVSNDTCGRISTGPKRKGDLEFELQLEMALNATAAGNHGISVDSDSKDGYNTSSGLSYPCNARKKVKSGESLNHALEGSMAVWSRKKGPPLYWAEVFCSGETLTGRWVHIDSANAIIDGEQKVEAMAATCRKSLRYVVAFAGKGAKDVTRRYCMKWYTIAAQRVSPLWWNSVLSPLKELELVATGDEVSVENHSINPLSEVGTFKAVKLPGTSQAHLNEASGSSVGQECVQDASRLTASIEIEANKAHVMEMHTESSKNISVAVNRSLLEDMELETRALTEPLPTNQLAYKNHQLYAIERWLTKYQVLHPKGPVLGYCSGHPVYPRTCVHTVQTKQRWLREGFQIKENESPAKVVKRSQKCNKPQISEPNFHDEDEAEEAILLYGKWQTETLSLPRAVNGIVPKNERGQVDVWSEKCLPPGTTHLRLPRLVPVVRRLGIDFAPAMVGFEFRNGRSIPIFEGIVVCTEFCDAIIEAYAEEEERREAEEKKRSKARALSRWYQLLCNMVTRQRLKTSYQDRSPSRKGELTNCEGDRYETQARDDANLASDSCLDFQSAALSGDHEHVFPVENQVFDEESSIWTKRCPCGFSVQVEEM